MENTTNNDESSNSIRFHGIPKEEPTVHIEKANVHGNASYRMNRQHAISIADFTVTESTQYGSKRIGNYALGPELGEGSYGKVTVGRHLESGELVALKFIEEKPSVSYAQSALRDITENEIHILSKLREINSVDFVQLVDSMKIDTHDVEQSEVEIVNTSDVQKSTMFETEKLVANSPCIRVIAMTLSMGASLQEAMNHYGYQGFPPGLFYRISCCLLQAISDLHDNDIGHCDLKVNNIIILGDWKGYEKNPTSQNRPRIQLIDFGSALDLTLPGTSTSLPLSHYGYRKQSRFRSRKNSTVRKTNCSCFSPLLGSPMFTAPELLQISFSDGESNSPSPETKSSETEKKLPPCDSQKKYLWLNNWGLNNVCEETNVSEENDGCFCREDIEAMDMWAVGICLTCIGLGYHPFLKYKNISNVFEIIDIIQRNNPDFGSLDQRFPGILTVLKGMLQKDPKLRPTAKKALVLMKQSAIQSGHKEWL